MTAELLVTGATGNVGFEVASSLRALGVEFRAADVDPNQVYARLGEFTETARFRFGDASTYPDAFCGIKKVFLMRPPQITKVRQDMFPAIDAALAAGVQHFVFLSLIGIENNTSVPHYKVEQYLRSLGVDYTFLRASFFMQNFNTAHCAEIRDRSELFIPAGRSKTSFLDTRDIGAVAAVSLTQPGHGKKAYDLTGPEALDYVQVAERMSREFGRNIIYRNPSIPAFVYRKLRDGTPLPFALVMAFLYWNTRSGMAQVVTGEVERLTGRKPIALSKYLKDYRQYWL